MLICFRQAHASMAAFERGEADLVFENADASTGCRLLQVRHNGGLTETAFLGGSEYLAQMLQNGFGRSRPRHVARLR
jgi:hypothetical protein